MQLLYLIGVAIRGIVMKLIIPRMLRGIVPPTYRSWGFSGSSFCIRSTYTYDYNDYDQLTDIKNGQRLLL